MKLFTLGYGSWPPARRVDRLVASLQDAGVRLLIDVRHSPCASQIDSLSNYGPRNWHLQAGAGAGFVGLLEKHGVEYRWLVELGNPQKNDPTMAILREHLVSADLRWPVNRGLELLRPLLTEARPAALLCACKDFRVCHRTLVAEAACQRFPALKIEICHLP